MKNFCSFTIGLTILCATLTSVGTSASAQNADNITANLMVGGGQQVAYESTTTAIPGDVVNFRVYIQKTSPSPSIKSEVEDTLDSRLTYVSETSSVTSKQDDHDVMFPIKDALIKKEGQMLRWGMVTQTSNGTYLTFRAKLGGDSAFPVGTTRVQNHVVVSFADGRKITPSATIIVTRYASPTVILGLRLDEVNISSKANQWSGDGEQVAVALGDTVQYRLIATNEGNVSASNVSIKDVLPPGMTPTGFCKIYDDNHPKGYDADIADLVGNGIVISELLNGNSHAVTVMFAAKVGTLDPKRVGLTNTGRLLYSGKVADEKLISVLPTTH